MSLTADYQLKDKSKHPCIEIRPYFLFVLEYMPLMGQLKELVGAKYYSIYKQYINSPLEIPPTYSFLNHNGTEPMLSQINFHRGDQVQIMNLKYKTLTGVISQIGGYGSAFYSVGVAIVGIMF